MSSWDPVHPPKNVCIFCRERAEYVAVSRLVNLYDNNKGPAQTGFRRDERHYVCYKGKCKSWTLGITNFKYLVNSAGDIVVDKRSKKEREGGTGD